MFNFTIKSYVFYVQAPRERWKDHLSLTVTQHSSSAHDRRNDAQYSHGVTLSAIRSHVLREIPSLKEISVHTIHCLLLPPNKNRKAAKHYQSLIDAKRPPKRNDLTCRTHPNFHYTSAQVNIVGELAEMFSNETIAISADDKHKVNVGTLAVSRHFSINNIFATDDQPNYPDHDSVCKCKTCSCRVFVT